MISSNASRSVSTRSAMSRSMVTAAARDDVGVPLDDVLLEDHDPVQRVVFEHVRAIHEGHERGVIFEGCPHRILSADVGIDLNGLIHEAGSRSVPPPPTPARGQCRVGRWRGGVSTRRPGRHASRGFPPGARPVAIGR